MLSEVSRAGARILLVEDEGILAATLKRRLETMGYEIVGCAASGAEALLLAAETTPGLVLMDIVIQGPMDGVATAEELTRRSDVPVVFLTGHSLTETVQRASHVRNYGYLMKPFDDHELQATIEMALYRHQTEAQARLLQQALATAATGLVVADARSPGRPITLCNPAFERLTGYSAADVIGQPACFLQQANCDQEASAELHRALDEHRDCRITMINHRKDGQPFWNELTLSAVRNAVGEVTHFLLLHVDVSDRRRTEEALLQAQKLQALGQLASGIAHDFNNALTTVITFSGFVRDDLPEGDPRREDIVEVLRAADKATSLTRQLLSFSRPHPCAKRPFDINVTLANLARILARTLGKKIAVELTASAQPAMVRMDPIRLEQVLLNLAINARDAMQDGGGLRFTVSHAAASAGKPTTSAAGLVLIVVADTGCGMDDATRTRAFEPFFSTKAPDKGTGLGLASCYAIVTEAGGAIRVESEIGAGTTFTIELPACEEPGEDGATAADQASPDSKRHEVGTRCILVVTENGPLRRATARILRSAGYLVSEASDRSDAVRRLEEEPSLLVDLIVLDVTGSPDSDDAFVEQAKAAAPGARVLLTSWSLPPPPPLSHDPSDADEPALLARPYSESSLLRAIRGVLSAGRSALP